MKKVLSNSLKLAACVFFIFIGNFSKGQSGQKWSSGGNGLSAGDFFGSTNGFPIVFKVNNIQKMSLAVNGVLQLNNLAGAGTRFLQADANGNLIPFATGTATQVLYGNGMWGSLPVDNDPWVINAQGNVYFTGKVGINNNSPQYALDVVGGAKINALAGTGTRLVTTDATGVLNFLSAGTTSQVLYGNGNWGNLPAVPYTINGGNTIFNGNLGSTGLAGSGNRILYTDASGNLLPLAAGTATQVLYGNGTWGSLPAAPNSFWTANGNNISYTNGNVGINNPNPQFALDVNGDARVANTLYVGQGVVISPNANTVPTATTNLYIHAASLNTKVLNADVIQMDSTSQIVGQTNFTDRTNFGGIARFRNALTVDGNTDFGGIVNLNSGLSFSGQQAITYTAGSNTDLGGNQPSMLALNSNARVAGTLDVTSNITFANGQSGLGYIPASGNSGGTIFTGRSGPPSVLTSNSCNPILGNNPTFTHNGIFQSYYLGQGLQTYGLMSMGYDGANGFVDVFGKNTSQSTLPSLLLNYYCGNDVAICTGTGNGNGTAGGFVFTGPNMQIGGVNSYRNPNIALNIGANGGVTTAFNIESAGINAFNVKADGTTTINSNSPTLPPLSIFNHTTNKKLMEILPTGNFYLNIDATNTQVQDAFVIADLNSGNAPAGYFRIKNDGTTYIGTQTPKLTGPHKDALLAVYGKALFTSAYVNVHTSVWSDYVFEKNYALMPLLDVEKYYQKYKHLPGVSSAKEMEVNGDNVVETDAMLLKKIEENTIYMVQMQKDMIEMKKAMEKLQNENEELKKLFGSK